MYSEEDKRSAKDCDFEKKIRNCRTLLKSRSKIYLGPEIVDRKNRLIHRKIKKIIHSLKIPITLTKFLHTS